MAIALGLFYDGGLVSTLSAHCHHVAAALAKPWLSPGGRRCCACTTRPELSSRGLACLPDALAPGSLRSRGRAPAWRAPAWRAPRCRAVDCADACGITDGSQGAHACPAVG